MRSGIYDDAPEPESDAIVERLWVEAGMRRPVRTDEHFRRFIRDVESEFGFDIPPHDFEHVQQIGDAMLYVQQRLEEMYD